MGPSTVAMGDELCHSPVEEAERRGKEEVTL
jgi:hypothetical protein